MFELDLFPCAYHVSIVLSKDIFLILYVWILFSFVRALAMQTYKKHVNIKLCVMWLHLIDSWFSPHYLRDSGLSVNR